MNETKSLEVINILGVNYTIEEVEFPGDPLAMGRSNSATGQILLRRDMPESIKRSTLLHEIIHQVSERGGANLSEEQTRIIECGLIPFFHGV